MVVVKIEIWPQGDKDKAKLIGTCCIANDGTGDLQHGNYVAVLGHSGKHSDKKGVWKQGAVKKHLRRLSPYHLAMKAIQACLKASE